MLLVEFRIPLPMSVEEFQVGQLYTVGALSREKTNGDTSVQILVNEPFENERGAGQYTHKVYYLGSKVPSIFTALFPASCFYMHEKAWNCYPYCRTEYNIPGLGDRFSCVIESVHLPDSGWVENAHNLTPAQLKIRKVRMINIATDIGSESGPESDPSRFISYKANRGPFGADWHLKANPIMCCYKIATIKFDIPLMSGRAESTVEKQQFDLLLEFARQTVVRMDSWFGMTMDDIRELENSIKAELESKLA